MKLVTALAALAALAACATATAQPTATPPTASVYRGPDIAAQRAAMDRLAGLLGEWRGEANVFAPQAMLVHQTERVERDLDGLLILVHGAGYATPERTGAAIFQAVAVISFDDRARRYEFRTYSGGHATTATGEFLTDGSFRWSFSSGPYLTRFTIAFNEASWTEIGEMSRDGGATWTRLVELNLTRVR